MTNESLEHFKDDLSAYLDGALPHGQKERLEAHLPGCADCRTELSTLRKITKMVGALPDHELPDGFMTRLKMKRLDAQRQSHTPLGWLPQPTRIAAFAATGILAGLVFFNEVRYRLAPKILPDLASTMALDEGEARSALEAMSPEEIEDARKRLVAENKKYKGGWGGPEADQDSAAPAESAVVMETAELLARSAGSGAPRNEVSAVRGLAPEPEKRAPAKTGGAPLGLRAYTNDELRNYLDAESHRLGIKKVVSSPQTADDPWAGVPDRPMTKEEARKVMAQVTSRLRNANRDARAANNPIVSLGGATPLILGSTPSSRPVGMASSALAQKRRAQTGRMDVVSVPGSKLAIPKDQAEAFLEEGQVMDKVQGKREFTEAEGRKFAKTQKELAERAAFNSPKPVRVKDMKREQGLTDTTGVEPIPVLRSWGSTSGGMGVAGGAVLTKPEDFADLWQRIGNPEPLPAVDFEKEMAVAVFVARSDSVRRAEIVSVVRQGGRVLIRYRVAAVAKAKGPSAPYHVVIVERSDEPFGFVQVP